MNENTSKAIASISIGAAVAVAVFVTKDGAYLWGLLALMFIW